MALKFLNNGYFAGKVGIGVEVPTYTLELQVSQPDENPVVYSQFGGNNGVAGNSFLQIGGARGSAASERYSYLQTLDGAGGFRILSLNPSGGNVGIGTTAPNLNSNTLALTISAGTSGSKLAGLDLQGSATTDTPFVQINGYNGANIVTSLNTGRDGAVNSGFYAFYTANAGSLTEKVRIDKLGNVGIGTPSPSVQLDIEDSSNVLVDMNTTTANANTTIRLQESGAVKATIGYDGTNDGLILTTGGFTAGNGIFIDDSQNVGIGTASPSTRLEVAASATTSVDIAHFSNSNDVVKIKHALDGLGSGRVSIFDASNNEDVRLSAQSNSWFNAGNVGIGTDSPEELLHIKNGDAGVTPYDLGTGLNIEGTTSNVGINIVSSNTGQGRIYFASPSSNTAGAIEYNHNATLSSGFMKFRTGNSERMRIDGSGNVGIGTTSPVAKLDVLGTSGGPAVFDYTYATNAGVRIHGSESAMDIVGTDGGNHASTILLRNGNEGFGLLNNPNLNTLQFRSFTATADGFAIHNTGTNLSSLVDIVTLEKTGNVGIGTTSPQQKLDVVGRVRASYDTSNYYEIGASSAGGFVVGKSGGVETVNIRTYGDSHFNGGNFGIGTSSPTAKLHVVGTGLFTGLVSGITPVAAANFVTKAYVDGSGGGTGPFLPLAGGTMTGTIIQNGGNIDFSDGRSANFGNGDDLQIYHDGSNSFMVDAGTGDMLHYYSNDWKVIKYGTGELSIWATTDAGVKLYYDNDKKFETTTTGVTVTGDVQIDSALLSNQENTDVDTGTETVANVAIATYTAAFFDFVIKKTTNVRSGTVYACHDGTNVEFTETSTQDLGDTSDVTLSVDISGGNMRLRATTTSDDWSVKSLIRAI